MTHGNKNLVSGIVKAVDKINVVYTKNDVQILNGVDKYTQKKWQEKVDTSQEIKK